MKYLPIFALLVSLLGANCKRDERIRNECLMKAKADTGCDNVRLISKTKKAWAGASRVFMFDACGKKVVYEWGKWCEDCNRSCRKAAGR